MFCNLCVNLLCRSGKGGYMDIVVTRLIRNFLIKKFYLQIFLENWKIEIRGFCMAPTYFMHKLCIFCSKNHWLYISAKSLSKTTRIFWWQIKDPCNKVWEKLAQIDHQTFKNSQKVEPKISSNSIKQFKSTI